jgi:hypothetical protein
LTIIILLFFIQFKDEFSTKSEYKAGEQIIFLQGTDGGDGVKEGMS